MSICIVMMLCWRVTDMSFTEVKKVYIEFLKFLNSERIGEKNCLLIQITPNFVFNGYYVLKCVKIFPRLIILQKWFLEFHHKRINIFSNVLTKFQRGKHCLLELKFLDASICNHQKNKNNSRKKEESID